VRRNETDRTARLFVRGRADVHNHSGVLRTRRQTVGHNLNFLDVSFGERLKQQSDELPGGLARLLNFRRADNYSWSIRCRLRLALLNPRSAATIDYWLCAAPRLYGLLLRYRQILHIAVIYSRAQSVLPASQLSIEIRDDS
jgi:hypothetical protein